MASQVATRVSRRAALRSLNLTVRPRYLSVALGLLVVLVYAGMAASWRSYGVREDAANERYDNALALLQAPSADIEQLRADVEQAKSAVASAEALVAAPSVDLASDEAIELLVLGAEATGLSVRGVERLAVGPAKVQDLDFDRTSLRITVDGRPSDVSAFLTLLDGTHPALIASLESMEITDGIARAAVVFTGYAKAEAAAPEAGAPSP